MAFGRAVITFSVLPSLKGLRPSEILVGNLVLVGCKSLCPFFFFFLRNMLGLKSVSFTCMKDGCNGVECFLGGVKYSFGD